jgi:hypothetical protein
MAGRDGFRNSGIRKSKRRLWAGRSTRQNIAIGPDAAEFPNLRNETIATRGDGFDVSWAVLPVLQRFPQYRDMLGEIRFFDEGIRPDLSQQFIFFEQVSTILNQDNQGVERLRRQAYWDLIAKQESLGGIQAKRAELENHFCLHGHMAFTKVLEKLYVRLKTTNRLCG